MTTDSKLLMELSIYSHHFRVLADYFNLTEAQRLDPNASEWIIDRVKQIQTAYMIRKSMADKDQFPVAPAPNPLLEKETPWQIDVLV